MITPAVPDPPEIDEALWSDFPLGDAAFDIGANCGQTISRLLSICTDVVAFEPSVEAFEYLESEFGYFDTVSLENFAVSNITGDITLMAAPSKIATGQLVTHGTEGMEWSEEEMKDGVERVVKATTVDDFVESTGVVPSFMKIDVEGHEGAVIDGAVKTIDKYRPTMLIEIHSEKLGDKIKGQLRSFYDIVEIRHPHYTPGSVLWATHFWLKCFAK